MQTVEIREVEIDRTVYPRDSHDNETVSRYRQALDRLPPIKLNEDLILIDGYHRLLAHQVAGKERIEAEILDVPHEDILVEAIRLNAQHGKQLSQAEKRRHTKALWKQRATGPSDPDTVEWIAGLLSITNQAVYNATKSIRTEQKKGQKQDAWNMWLACQSQAEIAEALGVHKTTIGNWLDSRISKDVEKFYPDSLQLYDVWNFSTCDDRYGISGYPGQIPGQIVENVLHYYTEPGDIVLDPMAGGGTVIDVCKAMGRRYLAYDLKPIRDEIQQHDITTGAPDLPATANSGVQLVFIDPPYWSMKDGDYTEGSVSDKTLEEFNAWLTHLGNVVFNLLSPGGYLAFLIQNQTEKDIPATLHYIDHAIEAYNRFVNVGFEPVRRVACPQSSQTFTAQQVERAKKDNHLMGLVRDLLIMRKAVKA